MASHHLSGLLVLLLLLLAIATASADIAAPATPSQEQQVNSIIEALIGAGDFKSWANMISAADFAAFPLSATFFIPCDDSLSHFSSATVTIDPYIIPYHIVPQRLSFSDLRLLKPHSRLPTLLSAKSILVTNTSLSNFTLNNSLLSHRDLYVTPNLVLHGISAILDYSRYGSPTDPPVVPSPRPETFGQPTWDVNVIEGGKPMSEAACLCREFPIVLSIVCGVLAVKIYRNPLSR